MAVNIGIDKDLVPKIPETTLIKKKVEIGNTSFTTYKANIIRIQILNNFLLPFDSIHPT